MYKSPIEVTHINDFVNEALKKQRGAAENDIYTAIFNVGVNVDKDELIKALQYDRGQYQKGYDDGIKEFAKMLKEKATSTFYEERQYVDTEDVDNLVEEMAGDAERRTFWAW